MLRRRQSEGVWDNHLLRLRFVRGSARGFGGFEGGGKRIEDLRGCGEQIRKWHRWNEFGVCEDVEDEFGTGVDKRLRVRLGVVLEFDAVFDLADEAFEMLREAFDLFGMFMQESVNLAVVIEMNEFQI